MKLLISPINVKEATAAVLGGADIIDVKNPAEGSLGANFPWVIREIKNAIPQEIEISATLGDLDYKPGTASIAAFGLANLGVDYIKAGFFGVKNKEQGEDMAEKILQAVEGFDVKVVLSGYADYDKIGSISPFLLPGIAADSGADVVMIDTATKDGRTLFDYMGADDLSRFVNKSHDLNLTVALAGSIKLDDIKTIGEINPDIVGVRGLVCSGGDRKKGEIVEGKVKELKNRIRDL